MSPAVLIVDDNVDTARLTGRLLQSMGFVVQVAHDGQAAIEAARQHRPEVVLLDIGLPGIDGLELARRLRARPGTAHALLIAITGYGQDSDRQQILQAGFDHHLVKPIDIAQLYTLLDGVG